ncbi:hypothetical protein GJ744_002950 [Endocarpon pusillum]|uniref:Uncharacterized protein n=1 Tax=Endocarpon pusillum TaxID=364733 RepID=A0A8H7ABB4_9EURO|nr:hypothetical protein GJ744_002950 [Endocarpon pusillum]
MANESDRSSVSGPTSSVKKRTCDIRPSKTPTKQTHHQPSGSTARRSSSGQAARRAASTALNPYGAGTRSARSKPCPNLGAERSIPVRGLQQHPDDTKGAAHERQLNTSPLRGRGERGVQTHAVLSGARPSDAGPSGGSRSRANISAAGPSGRSPSPGPASQMSRSGPDAGPLRRLPITSGEPSTDPPGSANRRISLYMETELMISARDEQQHGGRDEFDFMRILVENHNHQQAGQHARITMTIFSHPNPPDLDDDKWYLTLSVAQVNGEYPYPLRLSSPIFHIAPDSPWRTQISATWEYLLQHYHVAANPILGSQFDILLAPHYTLHDLRRIASSAIHFEPAIEALLPETRHRHPETQGPRTPGARSNWLDSPSLARQGKSRLQSIAAIEIAPDKETVIRLMTGPKNEADPWSNRSYAWSFLNLFENNMIGFRKPPTSLNANDVLDWAEFLITFIQAAVHFGSGLSLRRFFSDLRGLGSFLAAVPSVAGVNEPSRWQKLWAGKQANAAVEPAPYWGPPWETVDSAERNRVTTRLRNDVNRIRRDGGNVLG